VGRYRALLRRARRSRQLCRGLGLAALLAAGCTNAGFLHRTCPQPANPTAAADAPAPDVRYRVGCPDVLEVTFADRPDWDAYASVDVDGRLPLDEPGNPRVEGMTLDQVRDELARLAGTSADRVRVSLAAPRSGHVFLNGPVRGRTRVVPYQGPEPVIDFLKRVGGLPPGSKLSQVYVVRPHVAAGQRPEVFRVDVAAVLLDGDPATNVPLRPSDQVYVGETRGSSFSRVLPHWLGAAYRRVAGLLPDAWWPFSLDRGP
jgi:protein involved in polysaccharide export with SLBB domain